MRQKTHLKVRGLHYERWVQELVSYTRLHKNYQKFWFKESLVIKIQRQGLLRPRLCFLALGVAVAAGAPANKNRSWWQKKEAHRVKGTPFTLLAGSEEPATEKNFIWP